MSWYSGKTLLKALNDLIPPKMLIEKPFRLAIHDVFKIGGVGTVLAGRVETGVLRKNMIINL